MGDAGVSDTDFFVMIVLVFLFFACMPFVAIFLQSSSMKQRSGSTVGGFPWRLILIGLVLLSLLGIYSLAHVVMSNADWNMEKLEASDRGSVQPDPDKVEQARKLVATLENEVKSKQEALNEQVKQLALSKQAAAAKLGHLPLSEAFNTWREHYQYSPTDPLTLRNFRKDLAIAAYGDVTSDANTAGNQFALRCYNTLMAFQPKLSAAEFAPLWCREILPQREAMWNRTRSWIYWREEIEQLHNRAYRRRAFETPRTSDDQEIHLNVLKELAQVYRPFIDEDSEVRQTDIALAEKLQQQGTFTGKVVAYNVKNNQGFATRLTISGQSANRFQGEMSFQAPSGPNMGSKAINGRLAIVGVVHEGVLHFRTVAFTKRDRQLIVGAVYRGNYQGGNITGTWLFPITRVGASFQLH